jgi:cyclin-dependent kinase 7
MPAGDYERGKTMGEGTYGIVFKAIRIKDDTQVAVKRIKSDKKVRTENEGLNITALREIKYLRELKHPNIIEVLSTAIATHCPRTVVMILFAYMGHACSC